jgi:hypothetical protein
VLTKFYKEKGNKNEKKEYNQRSSIKKIKGVIVVYHHNIIISPIKLFVKKKAPKRLETWRMPK